MSTPTDPAAQTLRTEQILELISEHIASSDRVVAAAERIEECLPKETERILGEHRQKLSSMPPLRVILPPSELPELRKHLARLIHGWGMVAAVTLAVACATLLVLLLR